jgi:hypothetical protein
MDQFTGEVCLVQGPVGWNCGHDLGFSKKKKRKKKKIQFTDDQK